MGIYITGDEWQGFVKEQTAFLTLVHPAAGDAFNFLEATITPKEERKVLQSDRSTLSRGRTLRGMRSGELSIKAYLSPSGALGVVHDLALFEKHLWGTQAITGGTSVIYSLLKHTEDTLFGLSVHFTADFAAWHCKGFIPDEIKYSMTNKDEAFMEITGQCAEIIQTGSSTTIAPLVGGEGVFTPVLIDAKNFAKDSLIDIGTSTAHTVSADPTAATVTITPVIVGAQATGVVVKPTILTGVTLAGKEISGITGTYSLDAVAVQSISQSVTVKANRTIRDNDFGSVTPTGFFSGTQREISFESELVLSKPNFRYLAGAQKLVQYDLILTFGDTAAERMTIDMNKVELDIPEIATNNEGEANVTVSGHALPTTAEDEATATYA